MKYVTTMALGLAVSMPSMAQIQDDKLKINLETPQYNSSIGQIGQIRGWATHPTQQVIFAEIYIDGELWSEIPVGGQRVDVENAYPNYQNSRYSGWAQTINYKDFAEGYHDLEVCAYTNLNRVNCVTGRFCVEKVPGGNFISDPSIIDFRTLDKFHMAQNAILLQKITIDGEFYNMELHWDTSTQGFIVEQVEPYVDIDYLEDTDYEGWCTTCEE